MAPVSPETERLLATSPVTTLDTHTHALTRSYARAPLPLGANNTPSTSPTVSLHILSSSRSLGDEDILFDLHRNFPLSNLSARERQTHNMLVKRTWCPLKRGPLNCCRAPRAPIAFVASIEGSAALNTGPPCILPVPQPRAIDRPNNVPSAPLQ